MPTHSACRSEQPKHRVLIVDDHEVVRYGLAALIVREPDLEVCGDAGDAAEALRQLQAQAPEIVIVDLTLGGENGLGLIEQITRDHPQVRVLVSSMHDEALFAERALRAGAMGYVSKQEAIHCVLDAIHQVLAGQVYLSPRMASRLQQRAHEVGTWQLNPLERLSTRELEVFELLGRGQTTQQIARQLRVSPKTVETHRRKIKAKLNLQNSVQLSRSAFQWVEERQDQ